MARQADWSLGSSRSDRCLCWEWVERWPMPVQAHVRKTIPKKTVLLGWEPTLENHPKAHLSLKRNDEILWMEEPGAASGSLRSWTNTTS